MKDLPLHIPDTSCKAKIEYPCSWQYKVIGHERAAVLAAIDKCVAGQAYTVSDSKVSSSGRYLSFNLEITVMDEAHRLALYSELHGQAAVKVVL